MTKAAIPRLLFFFMLISCNGHENNKGVEMKKDSGNVKRDSDKTSKNIPEKRKPPIINIVDTISPKRIVVCFKDSAKNAERISFKLAQIYGPKMNERFKKNTIKSAGQPMAWFLTSKAPYFFEAGIPVNTKPAKLPAGASIKELGIDSAVVAHFYGPYDMIHMGYEALQEWLTDHRKTSTSMPFEIYITDPVDKKGKPMDPYKVQTDIIMTRK